MTNHITTPFRLDVFRGGGHQALAFREMADAEECAELLRRCGFSCFAMKRIAYDPATDEACYEITKHYTPQ